MPIIDLKRHQFKAWDKIFLDANVLIYWMQNQLSAGKNKPDYFKFVKIALQSGATPFVNYLVMSEFVNASLRIKCKENGIDFNKDTRGSIEVMEMTSEVCLYALDLIKPKLLTFEDREFSSEEVKKIAFHGERRGGL